MASSPDPSGPLVLLPYFKLIFPGFQRLLTYTLLFVALTSFSLTGWFAAWPYNRYCSPTTGTGKIHLPPPRLHLPCLFLAWTSCASCQQSPPATSLDLVCDADRCRPPCYLGQVPTLRWLEHFITHVILYGDCVCCCCCSVAKSGPTLCDPLDCSVPGFPALPYLLEFAQTHVQWVGDEIQSLILCYPLLLQVSIFPASGSFPMSWLFTSGGQNIGASASASVLTMNIQGWLPLGLTGLIPLLSKWWWLYMKPKIQAPLRLQLIHSPGWAQIIPFKVGIISAQKDRQF